MIVRLQSLKPKSEPDSKFVPMSIHAPGLIRWAKAGYGPGSDGKKLVGIIAGAFNLKREVSLALLTGEVDYTVDGDDVVFDWPDNPVEGANNASI